MDLVRVLQLKDSERASLLVGSSLRVLTQTRVAPL